MHSCLLHYTNPNGRTKKRNPCKGTKSVGLELGVNEATNQVEFHSFFFSFFSLSKIVHGHCLYLPHTQNFDSEILPRKWIQLQITPMSW